MAVKDQQVLRAIGHIQLHLSAGAGLETVLVVLSRVRLGALSALANKVVNAAGKGAGIRDAIRMAAKRERSESAKLLLDALGGPDDGMDRRLAALSNQLLAQRKASVSAYGKRVEFCLRIATVLFLLTMVPPFVSVFSHVPPNPLIPALDLPAMAVTGFFFVLAVLIAGLFIVVAWRD